MIWVGSDGSNDEVFFWNGSSITQVSNNNYSYDNPQVSGNNVVWTDGCHCVYFWDGTETTKIIDTGGVCCHSPQISGNNVVWECFINFGEILFWDGTEITQIADDGYYKGKPQIWGNKVVWQGSDGSDYEIFLWDGSLITQVTYNSYPDIYPQISGNNVVWQASDGNDYEIFFWNGSSITQITDNSYDDLYPQISGYNIVWYANDSNDGEIFFAQFADVIEGTKWHDTNGNYVQDLDEQGLPGWRIFADLNENGQFDTNEPNVITDSNGNYRLSIFTFSPTVVIAEEQKSYWEQTYPGGAGTHTVRIAPGEVIENINFGNALLWEIYPSHWDLQDKLTASDGEYHDFFGTSVATSGDYAIVGLAGSEAAYIFRQDGSSWIQHNKLFVDLGVGNSFGNSVSISGDYVMVGGLRYGFYIGAAYIFYRDEGGSDNWGLQATLTASDGAQMDYLGRTVSISGDYAIAGANGNDDDGSGSGSAYIFYRNQGGADNWGQLAKLTASDADAGDYFGRSVAISGDYAIVGAHGNEDDGTDSGSAYIFYRNEGGTDNWGQQAKLTALDADSEDYFGFTVSISGDYAIVGAKNDEENGTDSGSAYIFKREGSTWSQQDKLMALDGTQDNEFSYSVSIKGNYAVVGVYEDDDNGSNSGSAYIFKREDTDWIPLSKLIAPDGAVDDFFGRAVFVSEDNIIVGAPGDNETEEDVGSAYIFNKVFLCPTADLTDDCKVNLDDIAVIASQWLYGF